MSLGIYIHIMNTNILILLPVVLPIVITFSSSETPSTVEYNIDIISDKITNTMISRTNDIVITHSSLCENC